MPLSSIVPLPTRQTPGSTLFPYTTLFRSASRKEKVSSRADSTYCGSGRGPQAAEPTPWRAAETVTQVRPSGRSAPSRSEEHTSELQSRGHLVCRLLLEKIKDIYNHNSYIC